MFSSEESVFERVCVGFCISPHVDPSSDLCFHHHHEPHMAVVQSVIDPRCFVLSGLLTGRANDTGVMEPDNIIRQPDIRSKKSAEDMWWLQSDEWLETNIQTIKKSLCHQFFSSCVPTSLKLKVKGSWNCFRTLKSVSWMQVKFLLKSFEWDDFLSAGHSDFWHKRKKFLSETCFIEDKVSFAQCGAQWWE